MSISRGNRQTKPFGRKNDARIAAFAAGLDHELDDPIDAIHPHNDLALEHARSDLFTRRYLLKTGKGSFQNLLVMNELVACSRQCSDYPAKIVEIHSLLERSLNGLGEDEEFQGISIRKKFCEDSIYIEDRGLLIALHHIYKTAAQAMKGRGTLTIETWRQNESVGVAIQDTGGGVPETFTERIFEPFFSTKNRDEGTGVGLALSREIVARCGGELRCENVPEPDPGTRFILTVPRKIIDHG